MKRVIFNEENDVVIFMELATNGSQAIQSIIDSNGPKDYRNTSRQKILFGVERGMLTHQNRLKEKFESK